MSRAALLKLAAAVALIGLGTLLAFSLGGTHPGSGEPGRCNPAHTQNCTTSTSIVTSTTTSTSTTTTSPPSGLAFGFTAGAGPDTVTAWDTATRSVYYDQLIAIGATTVRLDFYGAAVNDAAIGEARGKGLDVLVLVTGSNSDSASGYAAKCLDAVTRYAPLGVLEYEVRNEPNINGATPSLYAAQFTACADAIHSAQFGATVVFGALSNYGVYPQSDATHWNPVLYLEQVLSIMGTAGIDAVSYHPYGFCDNCTAEQAQATLAGWPQIADQNPSIVSVLASYGSNVKVWVDEHGAPTDGGAYSGGMSEYEQGRLVTLSIAAFKAAPWAGQFDWYSGKDRPTYADNREGHFGLYRDDWSAKPGAAAYAAAIQ